MKNNKFDDDSVLLDALKNNDQSAWLYFNRTFSETIKTMVYRHKFNIDDDSRKDLVQEILIKASQKVLTNYELGSAKISTWIGTIARNHIFDDNRKGKRLDLIMFSSLNGGDNLEFENLVTEKPEVEPESLEILFRYLNYLNRDRWLIIYYIFYEDLGHQVIADKIGTTVGNIKSITFRIRNEIKSLYTEKKSIASSFVGYNEAKELISNLNMRTEADWWDYVVLNDPPNGVPRHPNYHFVSSWKSWEELGRFSYERLIVIFISFEI